MLLSHFCPNYIIPYHTITALHCLLLLCATLYADCRSDADEDNCGTDTDPQSGSACAGETDPVKVCGTAGVLYDSSYPTGAQAL